jgi:hypothetical protein
MPADPDPDPAGSAAPQNLSITSHPDAGKTTLTEKLLLLSDAIHIADTVKARKATRYATSDWMEIEKQRGISVATSVMQMEYRGCVIYLRTPWLRSAVKGAVATSAGSHPRAIGRRWPCRRLGSRRGVARTRQARCRRPRRNRPACSDRAIAGC